MIMYDNNTMTGKTQGRPRLTITLKKDLIQHLDNYIDGSRIRNRSHAIEYVLTKYFSPKVKQAVILAGGKGLRMRPLTYEMPKAMIPVNSRPVLEQIIETLRRYDIRELIVCIGYQGQKIQKHFGDGSRFGVRIQYVDEGALEVGTAAPLRLVQKLLSPSQPFLVYYADVLANIELDDMFDFHLAGGCVGTMALSSVRRPADWGVVRVQGSRVYSFLEKPDPRKNLSNIINAGVYIFEPAIFKYLATATRLEKDVFPPLVKDGQLGAYLFAGQWFDVGTPESYAQAIKEWRG